MDALDRTFSDIVGLLKSWIPGRSEPANVSSDFWMPDQSCRVCYECDSQFSLFNRRHHCRLCGRVFCAKCTSNWIPTPSSDPKTPREDWDKIRHKSSTSFISARSSGTCDSSNITFGSMPQSTELSPHQSAVVMEKTTERQSVAAASSNENSVDAEERNQSPDQFEFCTNRSDGDDEEFGVYHLDSERRHFSQVNGYYGPVEFDDIDNDYESRKVHPDGEVVVSKSVSISSLQNSFESQASEEVQQIVEKEVERDNEWGYFRNSSSFGSGEYRSRDKSNEEHKKAMKNVVDGHFRAIVTRLLQVENLLSGEENDKESWLDIITSLSWEAATLLKPDTSKGGQMDPGGYVKVKCLASGHRSESSVLKLKGETEKHPEQKTVVKIFFPLDSMVVKGVVCKKNVAHRRMTSKIEKPRLLILGGALEYQRVSNALSSFDMLLQQEMDHLKMAVAKIDVHNPDILLVEKSVSRYAQDYLLAKDISLVLNIRRPLLERIARCTGGQIVPSIDNLSSPKLGNCDMFHVERFSEEHGTAGQAGKKLVKTLMYFEGCPKPLGCTILLRGANGDELKKVKHVVQYGVFAAYHLALETSFLADEGTNSFLVQILQDQALLKDEFPPSPSDHQSILVSLSSRCVRKGTVCERSHLFWIKYYGNFDKPSGRFLRDNLFDQSYRCHSCELSPEAHVQYYTHRQGTLTISVKKLSEISLPGKAEGKIWMWHRCLRCPRSNGFPPATRRVVMSDAAWGLSFGKFLELSFSNLAAASRVASCGHSLHRDCLHFYGFGQMVACFRYASIDVHSVYLPPPKLDYNYESQEWMQKELNEVAGRAELLFSEVLDAIRLLAEKKSGSGLLNSGMKLPESRCQITDLEGILQKEKAEFEESLQKILNKEPKKGQPIIDIFEINRLRRQLVSQSYIWAHRLIDAASLDKKDEQDDLDVTIPVYLSSFWESEFQGGAKLLLHVGVNETVIPVYDDEPTSIISFALVSPNYLSQLSDELERPKDTADLGQSLDAGNFPSFHSSDEMALLSYRSLGSGDENTSSSSSRSSLPLDPVSYTKAHVKVSFVDDGPLGKVNYIVTCYYAKRFEALRRLCCPSEMDFVRSLSRCKKWGAQGGKSNVFFAKTLDDRFIIKQVTKTELESFIKFAPGYFKYLIESIGSGSPTCLAKILGIYQVTSKHLKGGKETKMDVLVMENLLFGRNLTLLYDLKGSSRSRYNPDSSGSNKVLLDQNLIEAMRTSPIFVGYKAKRLLERAVWNDTAFLASIDVMDYSLLVGVDEENHELVLGIIDFMRQYTWDKHLETWVKMTGILCGLKNSSPTVISPKQYKKRFRKAMTTYFLMVPDQW
ncbi:1-phosphatidylinositol-3-phosphate 5-kinase FAB1B [Forsythia ovata]|uniref:1-phosphatidylinositol-3-phosphate 5-kinase n=1 Tax=Forsythia ovata TaxID=205694 RepID=A0ABD1WZC6_9LAMI